MPVHHGRIRRNPIALGDNEITADDFPPGDLYWLPSRITSARGLRGFAQGLQYSLTAGL